MLVLFPVSSFSHRELLFIPPRLKGQPTHSPPQNLSPPESVHMLIGTSSATTASLSMVRRLSTATVNPPPYRKSSPFTHFSPSTPVPGRLPPILTRQFPSQRYLLSRARPADTITLLFFFLFSRMLPTGFGPPKMVTGLAKRVTAADRTVTPSAGAAASVVIGIRFQIHGMARPATHQLHSIFIGVLPPPAASPPSASFPWAFALPTSTPLQHPNHLSMKIPPSSSSIATSSPISHSSSFHHKHLPLPG